MFEKAARIKLRFESNKGLLTAEDLFDLPLTSNSGRANLDDIAKALHKKLKSGEDVSFVLKDKKSDETVQLAFDIVIHVINIKMAEADEARKQAENRDRKQQLMAIIAQKESEQLADMDLDELKKLVAAM